jgi:hypothetical protein
METFDIIASEILLFRGNSLPRNPKEGGHNDKKLVSSD